MFNFGKPFITGVDKTFQSPSNDAVFKKLPQPRRCGERGF
jgi:hypothetical protein